MSQASFPMSPAFEPGPPVYFDANPLERPPPDGHRPIRGEAGAGHGRPPPGPILYAGPAHRAARRPRLVAGPGPRGLGPEADGGREGPLRPAAERQHRRLAAAQADRADLRPRGHHPPRPDPLDPPQDPQGRDPIALPGALLPRRSRRPTWPWRSRTRPPPTPPGWPRSTRAGSSSRTPARASASAATPRSSPSSRRPEVGLVVSTLEPRKNPEFLFEWFHTSKALPDDAELWWVGPIGWLTSKRRARAVRTPGRERPSGPVPRGRQRRRALPALPDGGLVDLPLALRRLRLPGAG